MSHSLYNMLASIKNGQITKKNSISVKKTKFCEVVLKALWNEGFILGYTNLEESMGELRVYLKYDKTGLPSINSIKSLSKPGRRIYLTSKQVWKLESSQSVIFSTNRGIKSLSECKKLNIGGEPLFYVK